MTQIEVHPKGNLANEISQKMKIQFSSQMNGDQIDLKFFEYSNLGFAETLIITIVGIVGTMAASSVTELVKFMLTESKKKNETKAIEIKIILQDEGKTFNLPEDENLLLKTFNIKKDEAA